MVVLFNTIHTYLRDHDRPLIRVFDWLTREQLVHDGGRLSKLVVGGLGAVARRTAIPATSGCIPKRKLELTRPSIARQSTLSSAITSFTAIPPPGATFRSSHPAYPAQRGRRLTSTRTIHQHDFSRPVQQSVHQQPACCARGIYSRTWRQR